MGKSAGRPSRRNQRVEIDERQLAAHDHSFPWNIESISWQLALNDFRPFPFTTACAASLSAKRSCGIVRWNEGCTMLANQQIVAMPRVFSAGSRARLARGIAIV